MLFKKITLERTECYGDCPIYKIEVFDSGKVNWDGVWNVAKMGEFEWNLSADQMNRLNDLIRNFDYINYEYDYTMTATDCPFCITSIEFSDGHYRKIEHYLGDELVDDRLTEFEEQIDKITGAEAYIGDGFLSDEIEWE